MMEFFYYNNQLKDELDGANNYARKAMYCKKDHPNQASMYLKMSAAELEHASMVMKIFEEDYKLSTESMEEIPQCISDMRKSLIDMYAEFASKIKYLHEMYERM